MSVANSHHKAELHHRAEILAAKLPPLMVAAERVAATVAQGVHGRKRVGQGETFWQFRRYEWGDPIQQIDWRRSAKSDVVYLRENEWEAAQSVWLWCDASPSMQYGSAKNSATKAEEAELLTFALASLLVRGGEHVAPLGAGVMPTTGQTALFLMAAAMEASDTAISLPPFEPIPSHGRVVLMSDFLEPLEDINRTIGALADRGVDGHILQIIDPAEEALPFKGRTKFEGMEGEGDAVIGKVEGVRSDYNKEFAAQRWGLEAIARTAGWGFASHVTDQPVETALMSLYMALTASRDKMGRR